MTDATPPPPADDHGRRRRSLGSRLVRSRAGFYIAARLTRGSVRLLQVLGPRASGAFASRVARTFGPLSAEHRLAEANLAQCFPEMSVAERRRILAGAWDNLARTVTEYVHLDSLLAGEIDPKTGVGGKLIVRGNEHFFALRDDNKPGIVFSAHLANWEVLAATAARYGLALTALFRPPANMEIAADLLARRRSLMGGALVANAKGASFELAAALERGGHLGILMDQRKNHGPLVPFFGRPAPTNTIVGKLARTFDCPVHGARAVRLPGGRFLIEITPPLDLPRDPDGRVNVLGATAAVTKVIEGWVREHPDQWLWLHDRWRIVGPAWRPGR
ncbi:MAG: lipid A biosynthesis lauroyl acyltransferase [Bauldia sp.]